MFNIAIYKLLKSIACSLAAIAEAECEHNSVQYIYREYAFKAFRYIDEATEEEKKL